MFLLTSNKLLLGLVLLCLNLADYVSTNASQTNELSLSPLSKINQLKQRIKRSSPVKYNLKLLVVVDKSMVTKHGNSLKPYLHAILSGVEYKLKGALPKESNFKLQLVGIIELPQNESKAIEYTDEDSIYKSFGGWKRDKLSQLPTHDTALFITRERRERKIYQNGAKNLEDWFKELNKEFMKKDEFVILVNSCHPENRFWTDGTDCGQAKWCINGQCVQRELNQSGIEQHKTGEDPPYIQEPILSFPIASPTTLSTHSVFIIFISIVLFICLVLALCIYFVIVLIRSNFYSK